MNRKRSILLILAVILIAGCTTTPEAIPTPTTALQKAKLSSIYFLETYKSQFKDAESLGAMAVAGKLSPGQLEIYRTKRALLNQAEPLVKAYDDLVSKGTIPAPGREQEINDILNRLLATGHKVGG